MNEPLPEDERLAEIEKRVVEAIAKIRKAVKFVAQPGKSLKLTLEFEDEVDLAEQWMQALADCKFLLQHIGRDVS